MPNATKRNYGSQDLDESAKKLSTLAKRSTTYQLAGKDYTFKAKDVLNKVTYKDGKYVYLDASTLTKQVKAIASKVNTLRTSYPFKTPTGKTITIQNKSYGWAINTPQAVKAIEDGLSSGAKTVDGKSTIFGDGFTDEGTGYGITANHGLGKDYIVVSLSAQKVWIYKNNKPVVTLDDVVTGTVTTSKGDSDATPTGVWYIGYKQTPSVLRGTNDDGSSYASKVSYWMPFTVDGCGFHDASWRTDWSKTAYLKGGSHGCVNVRPAEIKSVWDNVSTHEPVIVY
nr:L,D-transpeptidase family protein [Lactobacillus sp. PV012]